jgi:predicted anti-sigma-YlaC factor YlaD
MNEAHCEMARERLADLVGGRLAPAEAALVQAHLDTCAECADEAALVRLLFSARPAAPADLARRIEGSASVRRRHAYHPWWGLAAASVAAVALGIGVVSKDTPLVEVAGEVEVPGIVVGVEETSLWVADDGLVAGAPALEALSDEALLQLLEEMGTESTGGAA